MWTIISDMNGVLRQLGRSNDLSDVQEVVLRDMQFIDDNAIELRARFSGYRMPRRDVATELPRLDRVSLDIRQITAESGLYLLPSDATGLEFIHLATFLGIIRYYAVRGRVLREHFAAALNR